MTRARATRYGTLLRVVLALILTMALAALILTMALAACNDVEDTGSPGSLLEQAAEFEATQEAETSGSQSLSESSATDPARESTVELVACPPRPANPLPAQTSAETDRDALVAIFDATDGDGWDESGTWAGRQPIGEWAGVTTDDDGRVVGLDVNLGGAEIPSEVGHLTGLTTLTLSGVSGALPPELAYLFNLAELDLSDNRLCGEIPPELGSLASLQSLNLGGNQLSGEIPPELDNLVSTLREIGLDGNRLGCISDLLSDRAGYAGEIPVCTTEGHPGDTEALIALYNAWGQPELENWLSRHPISEWEGVSVDANGRVVALNLERKGLTGEIPAEVGNLTSLQIVDLSGNWLTGEIPRNWANLYSVRAQVDGANVWVRMGVHWASVSAGGYHTCGVRTDGSVACWGAYLRGASMPWGGPVR